MISVERLTVLRLFPLMEGNRSPFPNEAAAHSDGADVDESVESICATLGPLSKPVQVPNPAKRFRMMNRGFKDRV